MRKAIQLSMFDVAEVELIYKSKVPASQRRKITCSRDAKDVLIENWNPDTLHYVEEFKILLMNRANAVLWLMAISKGGISGSVGQCQLFQKDSNLRNHID
jgi:DNA repair protein RadC